MHQSRVAESTVNPVAVASGLEREPSTAKGPSNPWTPLSPWVTVGPRLAPRPPN